MSNAITDINNRTTFRQNYEVCINWASISFGRGVTLVNLEVLFPSLHASFLHRRAFHDPIQSPNFFPSKRDAPAKFGSWRFLLYPWPPVVRTDSPTKTRMQLRRSASPRKIRLLWAEWTLTMWAGVCCPMEFSPLT